MALPVVRSLLECADYQNTLAPYLHQLRPLPQVVVESITNVAALRQIYVDTNPVITSLAFAIAVSPVFLIVSEINKNYSQVDRFWSILPTVYNLHYALYAHLTGIDTTRVDAMAAISIVWSVRLTYNYWRKGGYSIGSEDYRWVVVRDYAGPTLFFLFNVVFIAFAQNLLLFTVTTPTYILLLTGRLSSTAPAATSWNSLDNLAAGLLLTYIAVSFVADQQQWDFYSARTRFRESGDVPSGWIRAALERGFLTTGLFAYSRHPNFAAEQSVWVALYVWSCLATRTLYNWSGAGAIMYLILFQSSTWFTELISARKYPDYKLYQKQVGKFIPSPLAAPPTFPENEENHSNGIVSKGKDATKARERYNLR